MKGKPSLGKTLEGPIEGLDEEEAADQPDFAPKHDQIYRTLRNALITGRIVPGRGVTLRGLAAELGVSPMPVREAIRRVAAEGGLEVRSNRRVYVPEMTRGRFEELVAARSLLEPEVAARALHLFPTHRLSELAALDADVEDAIASGAPERYMAANHRFHFAIYSAAPSDVLVPMIEGLWLRFGPFMRSAYAHVGTETLVDQHKRAISAIERRDEAALRDAIRCDILDGMRMIGASVL
jgi:DNA-binding GntR family transcriptional regulator